VSMENSTAGVTSIGLSSSMGMAAAAVGSDNMLWENLEIAEMRRVGQW